MSLAKMHPWVHRCRCNWDMFPLIFRRGKFHLLCSGHTSARFRGIVVNSKMLRFRFPNPELISTPLPSLIRRKSKLISTSKKNRFWKIQASKRLLNSPKSGSLVFATESLRPLSFSCAIASSPSLAHSCLPYVRVRPLTS